MWMSRKLIAWVLLGALFLKVLDFWTASNLQVKELQGQLAQRQDRIAELEEWVRAQQYVGGAEIGSYLFPVHPDDFVMPTSPFGERESPFTGRPAQHLGVDLFGKWKARILSVADGEVVEHWVPWGTGHRVYGGMLRIRHDDGSEALYGHLSETFVHEKQRVTQGQLIARQGNTGKTTGRQHLHFELRVDGQLVNPLKWVMEAGSEQGAAEEDRAVHDIAERVSDVPGVERQSLQENPYQDDGF